MTRVWDDGHYPAAMSIDLVQQAVQGILDRIASGEFSPDTALPGETDLAAMLGVSRTTMREAVRILKDRGVLEVVHGRGTWVTPANEWVDLGTVVHMTLHTSTPRQVGLKLVELRRMIEVGSAGLAAQHRTDEQLAIMARHIEAMDAAGARDDVSGVVEADLAFHDTVIQAADNPFLLAVMRPLAEALRESRTVTSAHGEVRERAQEHHREIMAAIAEGNEQEAKDAMRAHMTQTRRDLVKYTTE